MNNSPSTPLNIATRAMRAFDAHRHLAHGADDITVCLQWLKTEGFHVIKFSAELDRPMPVIEIETAAKCEWLIHSHGGRIYKESNESGHRVTRYRATILGCRVEWNVRGH